jgi:hypothetical protein
VHLVRDCKTKRTLPTIIIIVLIILLGGLSGFCFGVNYGWTTFKPQIQIVERLVEVDKIVEREVLVEVEKVVEKEVPVEVEKIVEKEVEVTVEVPIALKQFGSLEELRTWLGDEGTYMVFGDTGFLKCDGNTLWLQNKAMEDGYMMYFQAIYPNIYNPLFHDMQISYGLNNGLHAINAVIIGREFYYIEPQTREVALGGHLN